MTAPATMDTLARQLTRAMETDPDGTVVLAGHFAIYSAGGRATDHLDDAGALGAQAGFVEFTRASWQAACELAAPGAQRLLVLVDDIQYVRPALDDRGTRERLGAALAADYLRRTPALPPFHARELEARGIGAGRIVKRREDGWLFSERTLREEAVARIRASVAGNPALAASESGSRIQMHDPELGEHTLVHSGHTSCAGGYLELVMQLHERGVRRLVAVVPRRCLGPVTVGSRIAATHFGARGIEVVNIAIGAD